MTNEAGSPAARSWVFALRPAWMVLAHLAVFESARVGLYFAWPDDFGELGAAGLARALFAGLRFDLSIVALALAPALVALSLPWRFAAHPRWRDAWAWWGFAMLTLATAVLIGDACYFGLVHRHVGVEIASLGDDLDLVLGAAVGEYLPAILGALAVGALAAWAWRRAMRWDARRAGGVRPPLLAPLACGLLLLVAIRGNVSGKPIGVVNAFESGSLAEGYLTLNGPFSAWHSSRNSRPKALDYMPWPAAVANVQAQILAPGERTEHPRFPLQRTRPSRTHARPNVLVLLLEGWDSIAIDCIRREQGLAPLGLTPSFDALASEGVLFTRFYAAGQRSMDGWSAVLAGLPTLPGMPYIGRGMEQSRLAFLGQLAHADGYRTFFARGAKRGSFRGHAVAPLAGFDQYSAMEDILERWRVEPMTEWGAWDRDTFTETARLAREGDPPFLGFVFTLTTHPPFQIPDDEFARYPHDTAEHRYRNSLHYADRALGELIAQSKLDGWYDETLFVLVSDHTSGASSHDRSPESLHHVPCLLVGPGLVPRVDRRVTSQLDVLPTIVDYAGFTSPYAALGRSLLDPGERGALCIRGNVVLRIEEQGWVVHNTKRRLEALALAPGADLDAIEQRLLASLQVASRLLRRNEVYCPTPALRDGGLAGIMPAR